MYQVSIFNSNVETIINEVSEMENAPRVKMGTVRQAINAIDSFTFEIMPDNPGFFAIHALKTTVKVLNVKNNKCEFEGRVLICNDIMADDGSFVKHVVCEGELGYLQDSNQVFAGYFLIRLSTYFETMIENHNNVVSEDKRFTIGNISLSDNPFISGYIGYDKTWDTIQDRIISVYGGEIRMRKVNGVRYIDYVTTIGETSNVDIRLSKNMKSLEREIDTTKIITRLIPLGAEIISDFDEYVENSTRERVNISAANNGCIYLDHAQAIKEFGVITDTVVWDDVTDANELKTKGQNYLNTLNKIPYSFKIGVVDLWQLGLDIDTFKVGNYHNVTNPLMGIDETLRITEKEIRIEAPEESSLSFGEKFDSIATYHNKTNKILRNNGSMMTFMK